MDTDRQLAAVRGDTLHVTFGHEDARLFLNSLVEVLVLAGCAHIPVEYIGLSVSILLRYIEGLLQGCHAADRGAVGQVL
jgi:hypothetical protein